MKRIEDFIVIGQHWLNYKTYILELESQDRLPAVLPGNFAEVRIDNSPKVFLRRPFSIFDVNPPRNTISFFVKVVGEGTRLMGEARKGDKMNIIYPLGNSFSIPQNKRVLIVAGGSGLAPFLLHARLLKSGGNDSTFIFGGRTSEDIVLTDQFQDYGRVLVTTEDGTLGEKGLVTQHPLFGEDLDFDMIFTCGPGPMMKTVARLAGERSIACEASLENTMACGFGACLCCIVPTQDGNKCVCTEGPVFNVNYLKW
jgi:dihydroorotate dehydrogenase electron transfer subunit